MSAALITLLTAVILLLLAIAVFRGNSRNAAQGATLALMAAVILFLIRLPLPGVAALGVAIAGFVQVARKNRKQRRRHRKPWSRQAYHDRRSRVRTAALDMSLDPESGDISGRVLTGRYAGMTLASMTVEQLIDFASSLDANDAKSLSLISTYLDRVHPDWAQGMADEPGAGAEPIDTGCMTREQAFEVLGLKPGASSGEIAEAHRRLIKRVHPDAGGSAVLAAHINAAKARLL
jgi:hypothetical protein